MTFETINTRGEIIYPTAIVTEFDDGTRITQRFSRMSAAEYRDRYFNVRFKLIKKMYWNIRRTLKL